MKRRKVPRRRKTVLCTQTTMAGPCGASLPCPNHPPPPELHPFSKDSNVTFQLPDADLFLARMALNAFLAMSCYPISEDERGRAIEGTKHLMTVLDNEMIRRFAMATQLKEDPWVTQAQIVRENDSERRFPRAGDLLHVERGMGQPDIIMTVNGVPEPPYRQIHVLSHEAESVRRIQQWHGLALSGAPAKDYKQDVSGPGYILRGVWPRGYDGSGGVLSVDTVIQIQEAKTGVGWSRVRRLEAAIRWALGESGEFPMREPGQGQYWWRKGLRERAGLKEVKEGD